MKQMSKSSLATIEVPAYEGNYTKGRNTTIKAITIHHMAGKLTAQRCGELFQAVGRKGSSHYGIGYNGEIACYVDEDDTAWTNSNWNSNCESVTIETSNDEVGGNWHVSDKSLESLIKLIADIAIRNNLGTLVKGKNLTWHQLVADKKYPTACPGPYLISKLDYIVEKANEIINPPKEEEPEFEIGDKVKPLKLVNYNGTPLVQYDSEYTIMEINGDRVVLGAPRGPKGTLEIWASMNINDIEKI